jgi:NCS1 family nucleobase:cation symporter-1
LPFVDTTLYTGPVAKMLNGVDLSWIVGLLVVSPIYYFMVRKTKTNGKILASRAA